MPEKRSIMLVESARVSLISVPEDIEKIYKGDTLSEKMDVSQQIKPLLNLEGVFGQVGVLNENNRTYSKENYQKHIDILNDRIRKDKGVLGQLEHPNSLAINIAEASHFINKKLYIDENGIVRGGIGLLDNPHGHQALSIIKAGLPLYISSRGRGTINENGVVELVELATYDLVATPGFSNAKLSKISESIGESLHYVYLDEKAQPTIYESAYVEGEKEITISEMKKDDKENNTPTTDEIVKNLEKQIEDLKESHKKQIEDIEERVVNVVDEYLKSNANDFSNDLSITEKVIAEAVEKYIEDRLNSTNKLISEYLESEFKPNINKEIKDWLIEKVAPAIQEWTLEEYSGVIESYIEEELLPSVSGWVDESVLPTISNYLDTEYKEELKQMFTESSETDSKNKTKKGYKKLIGESLKDDSVETNDVITDFSEAIQKSKEELLAYKKSKEQVLTPSYLTQIPKDIKPLFESLSDENKVLIKEMANKRIPNPTEDQITDFWEKLDFSKFNGNGDNLANKYKKKMVVEGQNHMTNDVIPASVFNNVFNILNK